METKALHSLRSLKYILPVWYNQQRMQQKLVTVLMLVILFFIAAQISTFIWNLAFPHEYKVIQAPKIITKTHDVTNVFQQNQSSALGENTWFGISPDLTINQMDAEAITQETALNLSLKGTIMGSKPQAFIVDNETGKTYLVKLNENVINGVKLTSVDRRQVVITNNGKRETLSLPTTLLNGGLVKQKSEPTYTLLFERKPSKRQLVKISASDVQYALGNLGALATEAKFIPRVAGPVTEGYKIMKMKNNSFLRKLSLKERDIILKLDDVLISDKSKLFPMLMDLKNALKARLLIHRDGKNIALDIQVAN